MKHRNNETNRYQLVVSDLDGTMLDVGHHIPEENIKAAQALRDAGIGLTLATGRMDGMARLFVHELGITLPIIACNGAIIRDCKTETIIKQHSLPGAQSRALMAWLLKLEIDFLAYHADAVFYPDQSISIQYFHDYNSRAQSLGMKMIPVYTLENNYKSSSVDFVKIMVRIPDPDRLTALCAFIDSLNQCEAVQSMDYAIDVMAKGVSKGQALQELAAWLKLDMQNIVALGDHDNDVSMIHAAGTGIAMGNATQSVKSASDVQTSENHEAGFAKAVYRYILPVQPPCMSGG